MRSILAERKSRFLAGALAVVLGLAALLGLSWRAGEPPSGKAQRLLAKARTLRIQGRTAQAEQLAASASELDPQLADAAIVAAQCALARGAPARAEAYLTRVRSAQPRDQVRASLLLAKLYHHHLHRFAAAESAYRDAIKLDPESVTANDGIARLLGLCARKFEAIPHVLRLVQQAQATDLLVMLSKESVVIREPGALEAGRAAAPDDPNPLVGLAWHAAESNRAAEALELLRSAIRLDPQHAAAHVALGEQLLATSQFDALIEWNRQLPERAEEFPQTWIVRAQMAEHVDDALGALRCYAEASRRAPELQTANVQLVRLLGQFGNVELARRFADRVRRLKDLDQIQTRFTASPDDPLKLIQKYEAAGRLWEAYGWCQLAARSGQTERLWRRLQQLRAQTRGLPLRLTSDAANVAMTMDLSAYPLPDLKGLGESNVTPSSLALSPVTFEDVACQTGLCFRYFNGFEQPHHRLFGFTGGGVGVLDFELDGHPDVWFTQGCPWPPGSPANGYNDALFRNLGGVRFEDVTSLAGIGESGFGQGLSVGDVNADGFPDLYVATTGRNELWMNNGDGTFTSVTQQSRLAGREWTTSCLVADLSDDGLPDLYDVNYLKGDDVFDRVCEHSEGVRMHCLPFEFDGQRDRLWINDGDGTFSEATGEALSVDPSGKGLGIIAWDADGTGRLSLLVANDTTPNFFFVNRSRRGNVRLVESGIASGLALNERGKSESCMGIAIGDVDRNGLLDLHITNFYNESNTLYLNQEIGVYEDQTRAFGLQLPSMDVLGFGTEFLDADLDGHLELFVTNGHVDDLEQIGKPYRMPPQLFRFNGTAFVEDDARQLGPYFQKKWVGRAAATIDWNRDGQLDVLVGHLHDPSALLQNTSPAPGQFLAIKLFGVDSNRDAIGTTVEALVGKARLVRQLTAGDGYQASNQRSLIFGAGKSRQIDRLTVRWPSGKVQVFENVPLSRHLLLREGGPLLADGLSP